MRNPCAGEASTHHLACSCRELEFKVTKDKLELATDLLRHLEWVADPVSGEKYCPSCKFNKAHRHAPYCKLQTFFKLNEA